MITELLRLAKCSPTKEICGVIVGDSIVPITNVSKFHNKFIFSPQEWLPILTDIRKRGDSFVVFHSHIDGSLELSNEDIDLQNKFKCDMILISRGEVKVFPCET